MSVQVFRDNTVFVNEVFANGRRLSGVFSHALVQVPESRHVVKHGLDWISKTWTGLVKHGLVKHGLVKHGLVKHGLTRCFSHG